MMQFYFPNALHDFQYSLREQAKFVSNWEQNMLHTKS